MQFFNTFKRGINWKDVIKKKDLISRAKEIEKKNLHRFKKC